MSRNQLNAIENQRRKAMRIYRVQHGKAVDKTTGQDRPLAAEGVGALLTGNAETAPVAFRNAGVVCLERNADAWQLCWAVTPELLTRG